MNTTIMSQKSLNFVIGELAVHVSSYIAMTPSAVRTIFSSSGCILIGDVITPRKHCKVTAVPNARLIAINQVCFVL